MNAPHSHRPVPHSLDGSILLNAVWYRDPLKYLDPPKYYRGSDDKLGRVLFGKYQDKVITVKNGQGPVLASTLYSYSTQL